MEKSFSCCGMICSEYKYYPEECSGCGEIKGKVFRLEYTDENCCKIYYCCVNQRGYLVCR